METVQTAIASIAPGAWLTLIGVLLGSSITIFGVWLTNRSNIYQLKLQLAHKERVDRITIIQEHLEELYIQSEYWLTAYASNFYLPLITVMKGEMSYRDHRDLIIKNGKDLKFDFSRIKMIVDIYAPSLSSNYQSIIDARSRINAIVKEHEHAYESGDTDGSRFLKPFVEAQKKLEQSGQEFKQKIAELARGQN